MKGEFTMSYELLEKQLAEERLKVQHLESRLVFEKNKYELQVASLSTDLAEQMIDSINIELQCMEDVIDRLGDKDKLRLERCISRIRKKLSDLQYC